MPESLVKSTFEAHQPVIGQWARQNADNFSDVYRFVLATIQQPISMVPMIMEDYKLKGSESSYAFSFKGFGLDWVEENGGLFYDNAMYVWDFGGPRALLSLLASAPGLGLVKGGFMAQLVFGSIGCLDRHNVERFGLNPSRFSANRFKKAKLTSTRQAIVIEYLDLCEKCGGSALLWAEWCDYVAKRDSAFETAEEVSKIHLTALGLS